MRVSRIILAWLCSALCAYAATIVEGRESLVLEGGKATVVADLGGGSIVRFQLNDSQINPLAWNNQGAADEIRPMSHFLCLDRWGQPSVAEAANGMPFHGEATKVRWRVVRDVVPIGDTIQAEMAATLPMAGLEVLRQIELWRNVAVMRVTEQVTNRNKLGRVYNMVQHPTIGPPFLDESTIVDANARRGFRQTTNAVVRPEEPSFVFPQALQENGQPIDLRYLRDDPNPNVVSYVIDDELGWVTAVNAAKGLLIGYVWRTKDYPWLNLWRDVKDGKPNARGLEFGTTGLHQPFPILLDKGAIFRRKLSSYLDTGETATRTYGAFLFKVPADFRGVESVRFDRDRITVKEKGGDRELSADAFGLLGK